MTDHDEEVLAKELEKLEREKEFVDGDDDNPDNEEEQDELWDDLYKEIKVWRSR